jgi:hypothetical protein
VHRALTSGRRQKIRSFPAMVKDRDLLERHERLFRAAKNATRSPNEDPRKARYAKLVARTADKYEKIAKSRGLPVNSKKQGKMKK